MWSDAVKNVGENLTMERPGQPAELARKDVILADPRSSYLFGATMTVTSEKPIL